MKVLIYTHGFAPIIGGAEKYVMLLASGLARRSTISTAPAFVVNVVTPTPAGDFDDTQLAFKVVRQPSFLALARLIYESDVVHLSGACLLPSCLDRYFESLSLSSITAILPRARMVYFFTSPPNQCVRGIFWQGGMEIV